MLSADGTGQHLLMVMDSTYNKKAIETKVLKKNPIKYGVSAISCGIIAGNPFVDLDYEGLF